MNERLKKDVESLKKNIDAFQKDLTDALSDKEEMTEDKVSQLSEKVANAVNAFKEEAGEKLGEINKIVKKKGKEALDSSRDIISNKPFDGRGYCIRSWSFDCIVIMQKQKVSKIDKTIMIIKYISNIISGLLQSQVDHAFGRLEELQTKVISHAILILVAALLMIGGSGYGYLQYPYPTCYNHTPCRFRINIRVDLDFECDNRHFHCRESVKRVNFSFLSQF